MTAQGGETPDQDDLRVRFQQQARAGLAVDEARRGRGARLVFGAMSTLASVTSLLIIPMGLNAGVGMGTWVAVCALGAVVGAAGVALALRGRIRWGAAAIVVAVTLGSLGDLLSGRALQ